MTAANQLLREWWDWQAETIWSVLIRFVGLVGVLCALAGVWLLLLLGSHLVNPLPDGMPGDATLTFLARMTTLVNAAFLGTLLVLSTLLLLRPRGLLWMCNVFLGVELACLLVHGFLLPAFVVWGSGIPLWAMKFVAAAALSQVVLSPQLLILHPALAMVVLSVLYWRAFPNPQPSG